MIKKVAITIVLITFLLAFGWFYLRFGYMIWMPIRASFVTNFPPHAVKGYKWSDCPKDTIERNRFLLNLSNTYKKGKGKVGVRYKCHTIEGDTLYHYLLIKDGEAILIDDSRTDAYGPKRVYSEKVVAVDVGRLERAGKDGNMPITVFTEYDGPAPLVIRYSTEKMKKGPGRGYTYMFEEEALDYRGRQYRKKKLDQEKNSKKTS